MNIVGPLAQFLHLLTYSVFLKSVFVMMTESLLCNVICLEEWSLFTVSYKWHPCNYKSSFLPCLYLNWLLFFVFRPPPNSEILGDQRIRKLKKKKN